jgi:hypothetical protein
MPLTNQKLAVPKQWVVSKQGKFATVGGGLGIRPKIYDTAGAAQYDIRTNPKLRGGVVVPYTTEAKAAFDAEADKVNAAAAKAPGKAPGPGEPQPGTFATTTKAKAAKGKSTKAAPRRAAAGKVK